MNQRVLSTEEIRDIAFRTTGQSHNSDWKAYRYGKLTSSKFGRAIGVMQTPTQPTSNVSAASSMFRRIWITCRPSDVTG